MPAAIPIHDPSDPFDPAATATSVALRNRLRHAGPDLRRRTGLALGGDRRRHPRRYHQLVVEKGHTLVRHAAGGLVADSDDVGQRFRLKPDADSDGRRTPIPTEGGHRFRAIPDRAVVDVAMESGDRLGVKQQCLGGPFAE